MDAVPIPALIAAVDQVEAMAQVPALVPALAMVAVLAPVRVLAPARVLALVLVRAVVREPAPVVVARPRSHPIRTIRRLRRLPQCRPGRITIARPALSATATVIAMRPRLGHLRRTVMVRALLGW